MIVHRARKTSAPGTRITSSTMIQDLPRRSFVMTHLRFHYPAPGPARQPGGLSTIPFLPRRGHNEDRTLVIEQGGGLRVLALGLSSTSNAAGGGSSGAAAVSTAAAIGSANTGPGTTTSRKREAGTVRRTTSFSCGTTSTSCSMRSLATARLPKPSGFWSAFSVGRRTGGRGPSSTWPDPPVHFFSPIPDEAPRPVR